MMIDPILAHYIGGWIRRHTIRILKFKPGENLGHHFWVKFDGFAAIRMAMVSRPKYHALTQKWPMKAYYRANSRKVRLPFQGKILRRVDW